MRSVKGMRDLLPPEARLWAEVEAVARRVFGLYGYDELRTPVVEPKELFVRAVGEGTDIVGKEMYVFNDRKGRELALRPESTAAVARAFVQHRLDDRGLPAKLFYIGPHFRYERPQKGRYRQFHQIGAELIGDPGPWSDVEVIAMLVRFLEALGFSGLTVLLHTVGDADSRTAFREALRDYLEPHADGLGADSRRRLRENPLRILDTKVPAERELLAGAPRLTEFLTSDSAEHFQAVRGGLDALGVAYRIDEGLVRGLDYYTRTVFEIVSDRLGAQDALVGGGRYDGLLVSLGGPDLPGIGFAIGEDRLVEALPESFAAEALGGSRVFVLGIDPVPTAHVLGVAEALRAAGLATLVELAPARVKRGLRNADRLECRWAVLIGEDELERGGVTVKDLAEGEQRFVPIEALAEDLLGMGAAAEAREGPAPGGAR